eukprot:scaffold23.g4171.t1
MLSCGSLAAERQLLLAVRRLLATAAASLEQQLVAAEGTIHLVQIPGAGRGLVAARPLAQGEVVHTEAPLLCSPSPHTLDAACYNCLRPLPLAPSGARPGAAGRRFCCEACRAQATAEFWAAEEACDLSELHEACRQSGEKFPLLAERLACMRVQRQWPELAGGVSGEGAPAAERPLQQQQPAAGDAAGPAEAERRRHVWGGASRGEPLSDLRHLCFANTGPEPPPPWADMHRLLLRGLRPLGARIAGPARRREWEAWLSEALGLDWYCGVVARLHINSFRVDTVPPLELSDPAALLRAAAGAVGGGAGGGAAAAGGTHAPGSATYALASMLNHSCEPNLDVGFPQNNAALALTAAHDVAAGEQLTISYIDATAPREARRSSLRFAYGFECRCPRCTEGA